ncbi:MAG: FkbM family methyltransferase [bacterium]|nr:FkbM family methyltransferase [bacterium]
MKSQLAQLPNGMTVHSIRREEALLMYGEVGNYIKHDLNLSAGATVVDVGANIGIFSLWAHEMCAGDVQVYAFEPIPQIFDLLQANFMRIAPHNLHAFQMGLSDRAQDITFAYYPNASFASTAYPDSTQQDQHLTKTLLQRSLHQLPAPLSWIQALPKRLQTPFIHLIAQFINRRQFVTCQLKTLSQFIHDKHLERIDFLKIDAEKSELDVLHGINDADWNKIQQVFIEVHNRDNRLEKIVHLLEAHGFTTIIHEQEPFFADTEIHALFAKR